MAQDGIRTPISEALIQTAIKGGQFVDQNKSAEPAPPAVPIDQGSGWMTSGQPLQVGVPVDVKGRAYDYPSYVNVNIRPRAYEPVTFDHLRALAENWDLLRLVIETRKDLLVTLEPEIVLKDEGVEPDKRCDEVLDFLASPDKEHTWEEWLRMILEDLFVIDAVAIEPVKTKGGSLYSLDLIDAATISRKISASGRTPAHPEPAYQQVIKGVPAGDFSRDELIYKMRNPRTYKIYGYSPVQQIIMTINTALRRQLSQLQFYTDGSMPSSLITCPPDWTPDNIRQMQGIFDEMLTGNMGERAKARFVPGGTSYIDTKQGITIDGADEWFARIVCYAFSVPNIAFVKQVNRATAGTSVDQAVSEGLMPIMRWIQSLINQIIVQQFGYTDLKMQWRDNKDADPAQEATILLQTAQRDQVDISSGVIDINEARVARGLPELTPEEMEARKPVPLPSPFGSYGDMSGGAKPPAEEPTAPDATIKEPPAAKLQKSELQKKKRYIRIDPQRPELLKLQDKAITFMAGFLTAKGKDVAAQVVKAYEKIVKADAATDDYAAEILASLDLDWSDLVPEINDLLAAMAKDAASTTLVRIGIDTTDATKLANTRAEAWAADRSAELVGMKWVKGELVQNPNAKWVISESTRDMIYTDVNNAVAEGWSNQRLSKAIQDGRGFDKSRADMIARTETAKANGAGALDGYRAAADAGVKLKKEWIRASQNEGDDCDICQANADQGPIDIEDAFESGDMAEPAHPKCMCTTAGVVED